MKFLKFFIFFIPTLFFGEANIANIIKERVDQKLTVGMVVAVISEDGITYHKYGKRSIHEDGLMDEDSVFELGSLSKVFTATLLQDMDEQNKMLLTDPIEMYLDGISISSYKGKKIELKDLATHMSALPYMPYNFKCSDISNPFSTYKMEDVFAFLNWFQLSREPGKLYDYSNLGVGLLGYILSGGDISNYDYLIKERICSPLGMDSTSAFLTSDMQRRLSIPHIGDVEVPVWKFNVLFGTGGIYSTAKDLAKLVKENMFSSGSYLNKVMNKTHKIYGGADADHLRIGLGWHHSVKFNSDIIYHNGATGGTRAFIGFCKKTKRGIVILSNSAVNVKELGYHFVDDRYEVSAAGREIDLDPILLDKYVGVYKHPATIFNITRVANHLRAEIPGYNPVDIFPETTTHFFLKAITANIDFIMDENEDVISLKFSYAGTVHPAQKVE